MPVDKLTIEQFAQKIKTKYPQYNDMNDTLLTQKVLNKYPQYHDMVSTEEPKQEAAQSPIPNQNDQYLTFGEPANNPPKKNPIINHAPPPIKPKVDLNKPDIKKAIDNTVNDYLKKDRGVYDKTLPAPTKDEIQRQKDVVIQEYQNGNLVPAKNQKGEDVMKRGTGFLESFKDAANQAYEQSMDDKYLLSLPKDKAIAHLNMDREHPGLFTKERETAPSGVLGNIGETLGQNADFLVKGTTGAIAGAATEATGGASFGTFLATTKDIATSGYSQALKNNYNKLKEQDPKISDEEAFDKASHAALANEAVQVGVNAVLSHSIPKLPEPSVATTGFVNGVKQSLKHTIEAAPKVIGTAAAGSAISDIAAATQGVKINVNEVLDNMSEHAKGMAIMHFGLGALGAIANGAKSYVPSYLRPQIENVVASAPREEVENYYKNAEANGDAPQGTTDKVMAKLSEFDQQKKIVDKMPISEEQKAAITGKLIQRKDLIGQRDELAKYGSAFNDQMNTIDSKIQKLENEVNGIHKDGNPFKFETDELTGQGLVDRKPFEDLSGKEKEGILNHSYENKYGEATVKEVGEGEDKTYKPIATFVTKKGDLKVNENIPIETDKTFSSKDAAQKAADKALAQHYYENGMDETLKPEKKSAVTVIRPEENKPVNEIEKIKEPTVENIETSGSNTEPIPVEESSNPETTMGEVLPTAGEEQTIPQQENINQDALRINSPEGQVSHIGEGGENIPESGTGVRPSIEGNETTRTRSQEENQSTGEEKNVGGRSVGASHKSLTKLADELGLSKPERGDVLTPEEYTKRGQALIKGGADPQAIADEFEKDGKVNAETISVAKAHLADLVRKAEDARKQFGIKSKQYLDAIKEVQDWSENVMKPMGTKFGEIGRTLQGETDLDTGNFVSVQRAFEESKGKPMTPEQSVQAEKLTTQVDNLNKQVDELQKKLTDTIDKATKSEKENTSKTYTERAKKVADTFRKLKSKPFTFKDENGNDIPIQIQGVSWNDLVELGAKAIEKTGKIADGVAEIIEKIKDTDWYVKMSTNDRQKLQDKLQEHYEDTIEETPEAKTIRRLQKELEDLQRGVVKQKGEKIEDTEEIKGLKEQIFEAKKNLGLISSRTSKIGEPKYGLKTIKEREKISEEQKRINRLEKQLTDLEQGNVQQKAEKFKDTPAITALKDKIFEAKTKLGLISYKGKIGTPSYGLTETPESRNIRRMEKQLEDLRNGIIKDKADKRPLSVVEKELQDKIFEEKKKLGLVASKSVKSKAHDLEITKEEKKIAAKEKEKADLEQGIVKQKNAHKDFKPTPEQKAKLEQLDDDIADLKKGLGVLKSKAEKPLTEQEQIEQDQNAAQQLAEKFANKKDNKFSSEDAKEIWDYAKKNYVDTGADFEDMISGTATDLGLTREQVRDAINTPKEAKKISDEMYKKMYQRRVAEQHVKAWVKAAGEAKVVKIFKAIPRFFFAAKVFGHGTVGFLTHAGTNIFDVAEWKRYFPSFLKQFKFAYGKTADYERAMQNLVRDKDYIFWKRAGLAVDPTERYDDYQFVTKIFNKMGNVGKWLTAGDRGFNALKVYRLARAKALYENLSATEKADKNTPKLIANLVNHSTGTANIPLPEAANTLFFAPRLEASRWNKLIVDPAKAVATFSNWKGADAADKAAAKIVAKRAGRILGTYAASLLANQALLSLSGSTQKINFTDPTKSDWLKFKIGDNTVDLTGGMISLLNFITGIVHTATESKEELGKGSRLDQLQKSTFGYVTGKFSPFASTVKDLATQHDFSGNTLPWSTDKPLHNWNHQMTWKEYLLAQQTPIPVAEAFHDISSEMEKSGVPKATTNQILKGILIGAFVGGTGVKIGETPPEKVKSFNEQDMKDPVFKPFIDEKFQLPNTSLSSEKIKDPNVSDRERTISEYPKETQEKYQTAHNKYLKEKLQEVKDKQKLYINYGKVALKHRNGVRTETVKMFNELTKEEKQKYYPQILSLAQKSATVKAKEEIFGKNSIPDEDKENQ